MSRSSVLCQHQIRAWKGLAQVVNKYLDDPTDPAVCQEPQLDLSETEANLCCRQP